MGAGDDCRGSRNVKVTMSRSTEFQRALDRYLGDPIAVLCSVRRPVATRMADPVRIGLIQPTAIGDLIIASGLIAHIRARFPFAEIHLLHGRSNRSALDLLELGIFGHTLDFTKPIATLRSIRSLRLDVLVDLVPWSTITALMCRFSGAPFTLGFSAPGRSRHFLFAHVAEYSANVHQSENFRALAAFFGPMETYAYRLRSSFPRPDIRLPYDRLVVCHIQPGGSQARAKTWPADRWVDLAGRLCDAGYAVAFSGSPADGPAIDTVVAKIKHTGRECISLAGRVTMPQLCFVLQHSRLAISVDTSPLHLASAVGVPVIGLHGPSRSCQWGAISQNALSIDAVHPSAGYIQFGFEDHPRAQEIMRSISVDEVYEAASSLLASGKSRPGAFPCGNGQAPRREQIFAGGY
jgi:ADP-heptose:LPS heptosyltransferase